MMTSGNTHRRTRRVRRNARYGALQILLVAIAVFMVGNEAESLWLRPLLTHLINGR